MTPNPTHSLLFNYLKPHKNDRILVLEGGDGWLAENVSRQIPDGKLKSYSRDVRDAWKAKKRLDSIPNCEVSFTGLPEAKDFNTAILAIPKGRRYARALLVAAWFALKPGGKLLLAGPTKKGAKAIIKDGERLFGNPVVTGFQKHNRIAGFMRGDSLPDPLPEVFQQNGIAPGTEHTIDLMTHNGKIYINTHPGIFSWDGIDEGTSLLLDHLDVSYDSKVWDVGCGYGVIGLYATKLGASEVLMTDTNLLAIRYTKKNSERNNLSERVNVVPAVGLSLPLENDHLFPFDFIVSNPAFHQEHNINTSMAESIIRNAPKFLSPKGKLIIVANRFLNYDQLMRLFFKSVVTLAETNKYHVLVAHK
jgi:16S rRNA (guanine1207-N2)-methyltransferase